MRLDKLSPNDRQVLVEIVASIFSGRGPQAAEVLMRRASGQALRLLRKLNAEEIVTDAVRLWVDAPRSRSARSFRGMLAGALLPTYRKRAARQVEEALQGSKARGKVVDVEYEVKR